MNCVSSSSGKLYPKRRIVAHFLSHGVTRERLATQIQENGGYHIVHWSGHGPRAGRFHNRRRKRRRGGKRRAPGGAREAPA